MNSPTVNNGSEGAADGVRRVFKILLAIFMYYLDLIVIAGMTSIFYVLAFFSYLVGKGYRDINDVLYETHERFVVFCSMTLRGIKRHHYGDYGQIVNRGESVLVIGNHQVESDYFTIAAAMEESGSLKRLRHVMKESLIWLPFVGAFLVNHGSFFIDRSKLNWDRFERNGTRLATSESPTSLLIYPEGTTWNNGEEVDGIFQKSDALARSCNREPFQHVLFPKHKGFYRLLSKFRNRLDAVYDVTVGYSSTRSPEGRRLMAPGMIDFLNGACPDVHFHLRRVSIKDVPQGEEEVRDFLIERFAEKDQLMDEFFKTGRFPSPTVELPPQSSFNFMRSTLVTIAAVLLAVTKFGLSIMPMYLGLPLVAAYIHVVYHLNS
ncbi:1-acyl-sn-glycerol-3-phosphate acyltransferase epsilon [Galendromus occidentalis]|uniref:1-acyl-sn-glycerol-3-phosphate acyltransferase epsilon n=1 Tax=Galendromus occidentalis TaxID=34638 RepID=A0AAJ6QP12_9ACAR|nr:1-acyl-sn-glycerol-3-phosphate acyltransferase epsilon [Galendromus occidentalis]